MIEFLQFLFLAFSSLVTPGPNNLMVMHSGLNFGLKRTLPHIFGILAGVGVMLFFISFGLGYVFSKIPEVALAIKLIGSMYLLYLAWKISQMNEKKTDTDISKPLTFMQAAMFQWVNPKAWVILIAFSGVFHFFESPLINAAALLLTISLLNIPCLGVWIGGGRALQRIINSDKARNRMNYFLAFLLGLSVIILWI